ncbi:hypothetical protein P7K49_009594 [Saguinus oedipus]|uniref:Uncharacterized protein n=1 Tax=Saguinus oedipus TaxID=9490 RepID=A0ABQ9VKF7_SAGOE|nr:hypothetical protein P7K49_009594 [Saguinus oedipus]
MSPIQVPFGLLTCPAHSTTRNFRQAQSVGPNARCGAWSRAPEEDEDGDKQLEPSQSRD